MHVDIPSKPGELAHPLNLVNIPALISAYYTGIPDPAVPEQRVAFGTSGHRGGSLRNSFNETHILAITQAICHYRKKNGIDGPLFMGMDTHALATPAQATALEVLAANGVEVMIAGDNEYTPTPAVSHAIIQYNVGRTSGLADGIIITPSHNPPDDGGFKYNPPSGGPADTDITKWVESTANSFLENWVKGVGSDIKRISLGRALKASTTHRFDYLNNYVDDLENVLDMDAIRGGSGKICIDPLGGASSGYWMPIAQKYNLPITVINGYVDPTFRHMYADHDGKIRMDPSSPYVMTGVVRMLERSREFNIAAALDTDSDRHGIVTRHSGLLAPNHYLCVCIDYLFRNRTGWSAQTGVGKTVVSSSLIDRVTKQVGRPLYEVPVGFKWFVDGLVKGNLGFVGEESAGAVFLRKNGQVWTTDKDGLIPSLLAGEIMARTGRDPGEIYDGLTAQLGKPEYDRIDAKASAEQKKALAQLNPGDIKQKEMAGETITAMLTNAPGNGAAIGGLKVATKNGWFAARPSGTEDIYKIYAESFNGKEHLQRIFSDAQTIVDKAIGK